MSPSVGPGSTEGTPAITDEPRTRAGGADRSTPTVQVGDGVSNTTSALQPHARDVVVQVIPPHIARAILVRDHYLHSMPGATRLSLGVFLDHEILGAITLGAGPINGHRLIEGAARDDVWTLSRLWLDDALPKNSESHVLAIVVRSLRRFTAVKAVLAYADPAAGHLGTVYQAAGWLYTGSPRSLPLLDLGDGVPRHCRSVGSTFSSHSVAYLKRRGFPVTRVTQPPKHRYLVFIDRSWQDRLLPRVLPYPKRGDPHEGD